MSVHPSERLSAYLDGALPPREADEVAAHLAGCGSCQETVDDLRAVRRLLRSVPDPQPHPAALPRTLARLTSRPRGRVVPRWAVAASVAAAALLLALQTPLPPAGPEVLGAHDVYFRAHAHFALAHPLANVTFLTYLTTPLPYRPEP